MNETERYSQISSYYGPGAIGGWLLTVVSVFVSWTLNKDARKKDTIDLDFTAVLLFPAFAAGHLFFQLLRYPGPRASVMTTTDPDLVPYAGGIEVSLNTCETFSLIAIFLTVTALLNLQIRRASAAVAIGLLCFCTETVLRYVSPRVGFSNSLFRRPFLLNVPGGIESVLGILTTVSCIGLWAHQRGRRTVVPDNRLENLSASMKKVHDEFRQEMEEWDKLPLDHRPDEDLLVHEARLELLHSRLAFCTKSLTEPTGTNETRRGKERSMRLSAYMTVLSLPATFVSTLFSMSTFGSTPGGEDLDTSQHLLFFISETQVSVWELDQLLGLVSGVFTLAFSIKRAARSYQNSARH